MKLTIELGDDRKEIDNIKHFRQESDTLFVEFYCKNSTEVKIYPGKVIGTPEYRDSNDVLAEMDLGETWSNYGDMSPKHHGGLFMKWTGDMWHVVRTVQDSSETFWMEEDWVEPMDIWVDENPERGYTDKFQSELETYPTGHQPTTPHDMDNLVGKIAQFSTMFRGNPESYMDNQLDDYEEILSDKFGIELETMDNVRIN